MKKTIMTFCALLAFVGGAFADDAFSVDNVTIPQNGEADVVVRFSLDQGSTCSGYTFWLQVPEEVAFVTYIKNEETKVTYTAGDCYDGSPTITPNLSDGYLKVGCLTANSDPILGSTGILVKFRLKVVGEVEVGDVLTGKLLNGTISAENGDVHDVANSTFTITIDEPDDGRLKFYETSETLPEYTAGEKANVTMFRTINAGEWSTIVLPFQLSATKAKAAFGNDVKLYEFSGFNTVYDDEDVPVPSSITINLTEYELKGTKPMKGGIPYVIKTSQKVESFTADDVTLVDELSNVKKTDDYDTSGKFTGTFVKTKVPANGLFISENQFWYSSGKTNIKAFRCWFELGAVLNQETDFGARVYFNFNDEATGIQDTNREIITDNRYYDLQGRSVDTPAKKGLYISNGKKVVVK